MGNKRHLERWQFAVLSFNSKFPKKVKEGLEGWGTDKLSVCLHSFFFFHYCSPNKPSASCSKPEYMHLKCTPISTVHKAESHYMTAASKCLGANGIIVF